MLKFTRKSLLNHASVWSRLVSTDVYKIHPAIGIARVGNSLSNDDWYAAPTTIGGTPTEYNANTKTFQPVTRFKNSEGQIRKQAAVFTVYKKGEELQIGDADIVNIKWKCWVANKKPIWWNFSLLCGDLMLGEDNSYEYWSKKMKTGTQTPVCNLRNATVTEAADRQKYIINPGPRECDLASGNFSAKFNYDLSKYNAPTFPGEGALNGKLIEGTLINSLGDMTMTHESGKPVSLFVRGGHGYSCGERSANFASFAGADGWFDDTSDGPVECELTLKNGEVVTLKAWVLSASPKYAPNLVNISTWDDTVFDMAVRFRDFGKKLNMINKDNHFILGADGFKPHPETDINPIFKRMKDYQWVSNIAVMTQFATPPFDVCNNSPSKEELARRQTWFSLLRPAIDLKSAANVEAVTYDPHQDVYSNGANSFPYMPQNAGDGCVNADAASGPMSKFVTLTPTQYYLMYQWAYGHTSPTPNDYGLNDLDRASLGNCVGYPNSPGIETCWNNRNPNIYEHDDVYRLRSVPIDKLLKTGLSLTRDETARPLGCEPGDMSKRMAIPWLADFAECTTQPINFTDSNKNRTPPQYYSYWWPAQSPYNVYIGNYNENEQNLEANGSYGTETTGGSFVSGQNVYYQRGIQEIQDTNTNIRTMMAYWSELAFIVNANKDPKTKDDYPNYVEAERGLKAFVKLKTDMSPTDVPVKNLMNPNPTQPYSVPKTN